MNLSCAGDPASCAGPQHDQKQKPVFNEREMMSALAVLWIRTKSQAQNTIYVD
jgi:hypothetical protein